MDDYGQKETSTENEERSTDGYYLPNRRRRTQRDTTIILPSTGRHVRRRLSIGRSRTVVSFPHTRWLAARRLATPRPIVIRARKRETTSKRYFVLVRARARARRSFRRRRKKKEDVYRRCADGSIGCDGVRVCLRRAFQKPKRPRRDVRINARDNLSFSHAKRANSRKRKKRKTTTTPKNAHDRNARTGRRRALRDWPKVFFLFLLSFSFYIFIALLRVQRGDCLSPSPPRMGVNARAGL